MKSLRMVFALVALVAGALPAQAARVCNLPPFGNNFVPLRTCAEDDDTRCGQIMPLLVDAPVIVLRPQGEWSEVRARNQSNTMIQGFIRSQFICNGS
jgi:hypothetical protein